jgi:hypothetical protein
MRRGVDMRFSSGGFGIKKRSWFGGGGGRYRILEGRPAFMEPLWGPRPNVDHDEYRSNIVGGGGGGVRMIRRSSSFPNNDAGYIGYLTDDESVSSSDGSDDVLNIVRRRRFELLGSNMSFSSCLMLFITIVGLFVFFIWGFRPPTTGVP